MHRSIGVKFMDVEKLAEIEQALRDCNEDCRDRQVRVKLEAYESSLKCSKTESPHTSDEECEQPCKKQKILPNLSKKWNGQNPKKNLFKNLVLTLNLAFSNYDFSSVSIERFKREELKDVLHVVNRHFFELASSEKASKVFSKDLWQVLEDIVGHEAIDPLKNEVVSKTLEAVEIYSYIPDSDPEIDGDPLAPLGNLWSFNYIFCNPTVGRLILLACSCRQRKFSQMSDQEPELRSRNSFLEAWDEEYSSDDEEEKQEDKVVTTSLDGSNLTVAF